MGACMGAGTLDKSRDTLFTTCAGGQRGPKRGAGLGFRVFYRV